MARDKIVRMYEMTNKTSVQNPRTQQQNPPEQSN